LTTIHRQLFDIIAIVIGVHVAAVFIYLLVKRENLLWPMFTGRKLNELVPASEEISHSRWPVAIVLLALIVGALVWVVQSAPQATLFSFSTQLSSDPTLNKANVSGRKAQFRWNHLLARFMREPLDRDWSYMRPNRKHLWRGLYLPGPVEIEGGCFVLAIDTSGSMSDRQLSLVLGEIDAIRRSCACELTVLQFDATIHAKAEYSRTGDEDGGVGSTKVMRMFGRGGTDLRLPFTWAEKERRDGRRISALIVCTDGMGPLPERAPDGLPVLFLLTRRHWKPSFGEHLVLDEFATG